MHGRVYHSILRMSNFGSFGFPHIFQRMGLIVIRYGEIGLKMDALD